MVMGGNLKSKAGLVQPTAVWFGSNNAKEKKFYQHLKAKFNSNIQSYNHPL